MTRSLAAASLTLALLGAAAHAAHAQDTWTQQVRRLLNNAASVAIDNGMHSTHEPFYGSLDDGDSGNSGVTLRAGTTYMLVGVCDNDCTDLDLRLFSPDGDEVDSDVQDDDTPVVTVTPRQSGRYSVRAIMANCNADPCRYGIGVYGK